MAGQTRSAQPTITIGDLSRQEVQYSDALESMEQRQVEEIFEQLWHYIKEREGRREAQRFRTQFTDVLRSGATYPDLRRYLEVQFNQYLVRVARELQQIASFIPDDPREEQYQ